MVTAFRVYSYGSSFECFHFFNKKVYNISVYSRLFQQTYRHFRWLIDYSTNFSFSSPESVGSLHFCEWFAWAAYNAIQNFDHGIRGIAMRIAPISVDVGKCADSPNTRDLNICCSFHGRKLLGGSNGWITCQCWKFCCARLFVWIT